MIDLIATVGFVCVFVLCCKLLARILSAEPRGTEHRCLNCGDPISGFCGMCREIRRATPSQESKP
jgi:hypothetical protein